MKTFTPAQFKKAQADLGLTEEQVARLFLVDIFVVFNWRSGHWRVPGSVTLCLHMLLAHADELKKWASL